MSEEQQPSTPATPQQRIAAAVEARGYRAGWTDGEFAARQIAKAAEELHELAGAIGHWCDWADPLEGAARYIRWAFDVRSEWLGYEVDAETVRRELPDVLIPLLVLAEALGLDALALAEAKAAADVARGVRGEP